MQENAAIAGDERDRELAPMPEPFRSEGPVLSLGLAACEWPAWFQIDPLYGSYQAEKLCLLRQDRAQVLQALPGSNAPARATAEVIAAHLITAHPEYFARLSKTRIKTLATGLVVDLDDADLHPIAQAALLVQEDLVLLRPGEGDLPKGANGYLLESACVCFPTRWNLPSKLGRPIWGIHEPVPGLNPQIGEKIDLFFARLRPGRLVERANWSLLAGPDLSQPTRPGKYGHGDVDGVVTADSLTLRVERQTLCKLADGRILFTIRIHQRKVKAMAERPGLIQALREAADRLPPDLAAYKAVDRVRDILERF